LVLLFSHLISHERERKNGGKPVIPRVGNPFRGKQRDGGGGGGGVAEREGKCAGDEKRNLEQSESFANGAKGMERLGKKRGED